MDEFLLLEKGVGKDSHFVTEVARLKVIENRLLRLKDFLEINQTPDLENALKKISEYFDYRGLFIEEKFDWEIILEQQLVRLQKLILELSGGHKAIHSFLLKYDFHNLKVMLSKKDLENLSYPDLGLWGKEKIKALLGENKLKGYEYIQEELKKIIAQKNIFLRHCLLDKLYFEYAWQLATETENRFLQEYLKLSFDWLNVINFLRIKIFTRDRNIFSILWLKNGNLDKKIFLDNFDSDLLNLKKIFSFLSYQKVFNKAIDYLQDNKSFLYFTLGLKKIKINFMAKTCYLIFGIEPIISYFVLKEEEIYTLHMILVSKFFISPSQDEMRERIKYIYEG